MKIRALFKKYWGYILAFVSSLVVISILFYLQGVAPFGGKSLLTIDFFHQYGPMLGELFDRIKSHSSLLYSFNMGMGLPFYRNFFNYLSSPFNILMLLFNHKELLTSFSVIVLVKLCFSTFFMYMFLKKKVGLSNVLTVCLSLLYSFSAYFAAYYWNIMWLDGMVFLPLIVYGLERMLIQRKPLVYVLSLSIMMFANYFIAYMICIFLVLYFIIFIESLLPIPRSFTSSAVSALLSSICKISFFFWSILVYFTALYFTFPSKIDFKGFIVSFFMVSTMISGTIVVTVILSTDLEAGMVADFVFNSCEYILLDPIVRKIANKTILNKFVCKGLNTIFVKIRVVYCQGKITY